MVQQGRPPLRLLTILRRLVGLPWNVAGYYRVWRMCGNSRLTAIRYAATYGRKSLTSRALDGDGDETTTSRPATSAPTSPVAVPGE